MEQLWKAVIAAAATTGASNTTASTEQTVIRQYFQLILSDLLRAATDRRYVYHVSLQSSTTLAISFGCNTTYHVQLTTALPMMPA
jgi:hypothetical protein